MLMELAFEVAGLPGLIILLLAGGGVVYLASEYSVRKRKGN